MKFLLIVLNFTGANPTAVVVDDYNTATACSEMLLTYAPDNIKTDFFVTCVGTNEASEEAQALTTIKLLGYRVKG